MKRWIALFAAISVGCCAAVVGLKKKASPTSMTQQSSRPINHLVFNSRIDPVPTLFFEASIDAALATKPPYLVIEVNSPGGDVDTGFHLAKRIERIHIPVYCVVDGEADSMMFYVLQSCPKRYMTKRSRLMAHQARDVYEGKVEFYPDDYISTRERLISLNKMLVQHYAQHLKISDTEIEKRIAHRRQWWIDPDEALKVGAVDGVVDSVASLMQKLDKK